VTTVPKAGLTYHMQDIVKSVPLQLCYAKKLSTLLGMRLQSPTQSQTECVLCSPGAAADSPLRHLLALVRPNALLTLPVAHGHHTLPRRSNVDPKPSVGRAFQRHPGKRLSRQAKYSAHLLLGPVGAPPLPVGPPSCCAAHAHTAHAPSAQQDLQTTDHSRRHETTALLG
jgi:hypothetical protein